MNLEKALLSSNKRKRIWEIDFLRGVCILLMIFDHTLMTVFIVFSEAWDTFGGASMDNFLNFAEVFITSPDSIRNTGGRLAVLLLLFGICGLSSSFSRSNFKRGIQLFCCAMVLTIGSYLGEVLLGMEGILIRFGVLHMLSVSILVYAIIAMFFKNPIGRACIAISLGVILLFVNHLLGIYGPFVDDMNPLVIFSVHIAKNPYIFSPGDFFPIMPNISYFLIGAGLAPFLYPQKKSLLPILDGKWSKPVEFFGRHTLIIMMTHLVVILLILLLVTVFLSKSIL